MLIYYLLFIWAIVSAVIVNLSNFSQKTKDKLYIVINYLPMVILGGCRKVGVGCDSALYCSVFNSLNDYDFYETITDVQYLLDFTGDGNRQEAGFYIFSMVIHMIYPDEQFFLFISSAVTLSGFAYFIYKNSVSIWMSTVFFIGMGFFAETFNTMRQCLGIMFACTAYTFIKNNKSFFMLSILWVATRFHNSMLIMFPVWVWGRRLSKEKVLKMIGVGFFVAVFIYILGELLFSLFDASKYVLYFNEAEKNKNVLHMFKVVFFVPFILYGIKYNRRDDHTVYFSVVCVWISCLITLLQVFQIFIYQRLFMQFAVFICILAPWVLKEIHSSYIKLNKPLQLCCLYLVIVFVLDVYMYGYLGNINADFYYVFFWE